MLTAITHPSSILTLNTNGLNFKRGKELADPGILTGHSIIIEDNTIKDFIPNKSFRKSLVDKVIDAKGKTVLPGLIDCHTHTLFAGSRANEFAQKIAGASYEEIARLGGGIRNTMTSTRKASEKSLFNSTSDWINHFISLGITSLEIKSGYGLSFEDEVKILRILKKLKSNSPIQIVSTFLGAHIVPPEFSKNRNAYIDTVITKMIPYIAKNSLADFCDVFCEKGAFTLEETDRILKTAARHSLPTKIHTDQFNSFGGIGTALKNKCNSADHLEVIKANDISAIAKSETTAVLLPGASFFLNCPYAPARKLIDKGAIVAIASDFNPGSSHIPNLHLIMSIASIKMKMKPEEVIAAVTINAAKALGIQNTTGSLEIGKSADFSIFNTENFLDISYTIGKNLNSMTIKNGKIIYDNQRITQ